MIEAAQAVVQTDQKSQLNAARPSEVHQPKRLRSHLL